MSFDTPGSRPESRESRWIRPSTPPPPPAEQLARELIEEDLRASARRSRSTHPGRLAQLLAWLREKLSSKTSGTRVTAQSLPPMQASYPVHVDGSARHAPGSNAVRPARTSEGSAREKVAEFSIPELQQVLHATLEHIANDPRLRTAYEAGRLPVVEDLLQRTDPANIVHGTRNSASRTRAASAMAEGGVSAEPSSDRARADSRSEDSEEEMNDDAVTLVDVASVTAPASPGKALDDGGDLHPSNPWYSGNLRSPLPLEHYSETTARPAARPDDRREAVAAENPPASPTSEPDGHSNPPAPRGADRTALTGTVGVGRQASLPDRSRPRPAARPHLTSPTRGRAGR